MGRDEGKGGRVTRGGGAAAKRESHKGEKEWKRKDGGVEEGLVREGSGERGRREWREVGGNGERRE